MSRRSRLDAALPLLALLAVLCLLTVPLSAGGDTHDDGQTVLIVELDADGDAHWRITERLPLADESEEAAFATIAEEFEAGEYDLATPDRIRSVAEVVDESTDRPMTVTATSRTSATAGDGNRMGTLTVSFTWQNFARMSDEGSDLHIGDVFATGRGLWLDGLTADQQLIIRAPEGYAVLDASVPPENGTLRWEGPTDFDQQSLTATFAGNGDTGGNNDTGDSIDTDTDDGTDDSSIGLIGLIIAGVAIAVVAALLTFYRERLGDVFDRDGTPGSNDSATDGGAAAETGGGDVETGADEPETTSDREPAAGDATGAAAGDAIDAELLSDEERVERLLERNGGRMKQADIVDETGWSNAKVSQLLSSMAEEGHIDKLRIGRENLISFPDVNVTDSDSDS